MARDYRPGNLPAAYLDSFIAHISRPESGFTVLTYADLDYADDWDYTNNYPVERSRWQQRLASGDLDPTRIYLFLQHDVDDAPPRTARLLGVEEEHGVRSTVMIFNRPVNRRLLQETGIREDVDYPLDREQLVRLERLGWEVGYHSNALERAAFDFDAAPEEFVRDVMELRREFAVKFFCPHGGARDSAGRSNVHLDLPEALRTSIRWTLNRHGMKMDGAFSDGRWVARRDEPDAINLRRFISRLKPGHRYRLLLHPQYYDPDFRESPAWVDVPWYAEICRRARAGESFDEWWTKRSLGTMS